MNIWLKELSLDDDKAFFDLINVLSSYEDVYAKPVPEPFPYEEFNDFLKIRKAMEEGNIYKTPATTTYWVMNDNTPIGYATLKHDANYNEVGGHLGLCLLKEYQNKGIGTLVSNMLSKIAYEQFGIKKIIYTSKKENTQSQKSLEHIGAKLVDIRDGYYFYEENIEEKFKEGRNKQ